MGKIRVFIAIELSLEIQLKLVSIQDKLKMSGADVKWVEPKNIHLTLKFLGYVSEQQLKGIFKATDESIEELFSFSLFFSGLGAFPKIANPRVIWVGVKQGKGMLSRINRNLEGILRRNGFPAEEREYRPHLTLGRIKSSRNKDRLIESVKSERGCSPGVMEVQKITVLQSILKPEGPEYKSLHVSEIKQVRQD